MVYHFNDALNRDAVNSISEEFNFQYPLNIERFMMDFRITSLIRERIHPILRGGMCMPFYTDLHVRRLSVDIDLLVSQSINDIDMMMNEMNAILHDITIQRYDPIRPAPIPNLVTYTVEYPSNFSTLGKIKIDYLCDVTLDMPTQTMPAGQEIVGFTIDYPLQILTRPALMIDKITALALDTIGLRGRDGGLSGAIPKQIYDISTLLKSANQNDITELFNIFRNILEFKSRIYDNGMYAVETVLGSIESSIQSLLSFGDQMTFTNEYEGLASSFKGTYLNTTQPYTKTQQMSDVLLVWFFAKALRTAFNRPSLRGRMVSEVASMLKRYDAITEYSREEKEAMRHAILENIPELPFPKSSLGRRSIDQIFLVDKIFSDLF